MGQRSVGRIMLNEGELEKSADIQGGETAMYEARSNAKSAFEGVNGGMYNLTGNAADSDWVQIFSAAFLRVFCKCIFSSGSYIVRGFLCVYHQSPAPQVDKATRYRRRQITIGIPRRSLP